MPRDILALHLAIILATIAAVLYVVDLCLSAVPS